MPALPIQMTSTYVDNRSTFIIGVALGLLSPDCLLQVTQGEDHMVSMHNHVDCWWPHAVLYKGTQMTLLSGDPVGPTTY